MMSEKEREMEREEEVSIVHFIHDHPLSLIQTDKGDSCHGCRRFFSEEAAYACKICGNERILHEECGEMPREIRHHPMHPQHTLLQRKGDGSLNCAACEGRIRTIGYFCTISACDFQIHLRCAPAMGVKLVDEPQICMKHLSHPKHELVLLRKRHLFKCDACGAMERGRSYVCVACEYWIHERCAALPAAVDYSHHHHPLSLAFYLPPEYSKYLYACDICSKELVLNRWVYHCQICRYVVHIKCAINPPTASLLDNENAAGGEDYCVQFPINDAYEELIKPFVARERGEMMIIPNEGQKYLFHNHHHHLSLVSSSSISEITDDENDEDDDDDLTYVRKTECLVCDGCTMPIISLKKQKSSSSSSSSSSSDLNNKEYCNYYMSCCECKYFLHVACFNLPPELPSLPLHKEDHNLIILQSRPKLDFFTRCSICDFFSNGMLYACTKCDFKADIKCASLPTTIKHGVHPHHRLHSKFGPDADINSNVMLGYCGGCNSLLYGGMFYKCGSCDFAMCNECSMLPPVNEHEWEKHPLPLRYNARLDHPGDFYCDACEKQMNPREWMYHCRDCDTSFHPRCFPATSGVFRNFKFGKKYGVPPDLHPHPLTCTLLSTKLRCDVCGLRVYGEEGVDQRGFHCSSCNFFMCLKRCLYTQTMWEIN